MSIIKRGEKTEKAKLLVYVLGWPFFIVLGFAVGMFLLLIISCCIMCSRTRQHNVARHELQELKENMAKQIREVAALQENRQRKEMEMAEEVEGEDDYDGRSDQRRVPYW